MAAVENNTYLVELEGKDFVTRLANFNKISESARLCGGDESTHLEMDLLVSGFSIFWTYVLLVVADPKHSRIPPSLYHLRSHYPVQHMIFLPFFAFSSSGFRLLGYSPTPYRTPQPSRVSNRQIVVGSLASQLCALLIPVVLVSPYKRRGGWR